MASPSVKHEGFRQLRGDESNPTFGIAVGEISRAIHICSAYDVETDWNVAADTNPALYIHSATTPSVDYIKMYHDGTDGNVNAANATALNLLIAGTAEVELTATNFQPSTSDGNALGSATLMWADLFLASGAVINFNNGDVTLTHALNTVAVGGGDFSIANTFGAIVGGTATQQLTISTGDGATNLVPEVQVLGTAQADGAVLLAAFATSNTVAPTIALLKSGGGTIGSATVAVASGETVGRIIGFGCDGTDLESPVAEIRFVVNGAVGTGDMPGGIEFYTTADGGETLTKALTLEQDQDAAFVGNLSLATTKQIQSATGNNKTLAIAVGSVTAATTTKKVIEVSSATTIALAELGFFGATPVSKRTHIANAVSSANASLAATAINNILLILENYGLMATS